MPLNSWVNQKDFSESVKATDDFFTYINGGWIANNPIPKEESRWGSFSVLRVEVEKQLKAILDELEAAAVPAPGTIPQKVRDFYLTAMDVGKCNALGIAPLEPLFAKINTAKNNKDLSRVLALLHRSGIHALWVPYVDQDEKNTEVIAFHPYQGGLGLPDRDYYIKEDDKSREIREKYLAYMQAVLAKGGMDPQLSAAIMDMETRLAKASDTRVEMRDPERQYNKKLFNEMEALAPAFDWRGYFEVIAQPVPEYVIVGQPRFFAEVNNVLETAPVEVLKAYLRWHTLNSMAPVLTEGLERLRFDFYGRIFGGATEMKVRWRRVLGVMNAVLEDAVGQLYVERHFSAEAKRKVNELVDHLISACRMRIENLSWMSGGTKVKAIEKLAAITRKLGYPDKWKDLSALSVGTASFSENYMKACAFEFDRKIKKIGGPVDRTEWLMLPQTVNACYQPTMNEITFPAAILQAPFFDQGADDALNFGGIGSVIGHELTHGFDDEGSKFDGQGNLKSWWTPEDRKNFEERADKLVKQFDQHEALPGLFSNGKLTLGENIADLGGLLIAYDGLKLALQKEPEKNKIIDGFTPEQRFFISYAVTERGHEREEYIRLAVQTDPHSRGKDRVNGPASNMDEFYKAFGVQRGDGLYRTPEDRVQIW